MFLECITVSYMTYEHYLLFAIHLCYSQVVLLGVLLGDAQGLIGQVMSLCPTLLASQPHLGTRTRHQGKTTRPRTLFLTLLSA
jgi:hypothetical protein